MTEEKKCCGNCNGSGGCGKQKTTVDPHDGQMAAVTGYPNAEDVQPFVDFIRQIEEIARTWPNSDSQVTEPDWPASKTPLSDSISAIMDGELKIALAQATENYRQAGSIITRNSLFGAEITEPVGIGRYPSTKQSTLEEYVTQLRVIMEVHPRKLEDFER